MRLVTSFPLISAFTTTTPTLYLTYCNSLESQSLHLTLRKEKDKHLFQNLYFFNWVNLLDFLWTDKLIQLCTSKLTDSRTICPSLFAISHLRPATSLLSGLKISFLACFLVWICWRFHIIIFLLWHSVACS